MEGATDALDFDWYVDEKKREAVSLYFRLVVLTDKTALGIVKQVGNQDSFEAYRRLAIRYAPRTLGRNLTISMSASLERRLLIQSSAQSSRRGCRQFSELTSLSTHQTPRIGQR
eukprot:3502797-Amphidinium_carterae.1